MHAIQAIRGFNDILPEKTPDWSFLENAIRSLAMQYAYEEIRLPLLEKTELFVRGVGEITDIVEKEMYCFEDRNGDHLCLRPEGTAGCVRAVLEHGLSYNQIQRLWYTGPMFRHERPQAGRYRQFYQVGFEAIGVADVYIDAELILMTARLWEKLGLTPHLHLQINTLGTPDSRKKYTHALVEYFAKNSALLDEDSQKRLHKNPLRILDSKNPAMAECIAAAPSFTDYLDEESRRYFDTLQTLLKENKVAFEINPRLVRGLDYYTHAVFEWTTTQLGAQATVCAGGRYDGLFEQLGGKPTPAVGWALGLERLLLLLEKNDLLPKPTAPWIYLISVGADAKAQALSLSERLRNHFVAPILQDTSDASFKSQIKRADKSQAELALIIGEDELKTGTIGVKFLRQNRPQQSLASDALVSFLNEEYQKIYGA